VKKRWAKLSSKDRLRVIVVVGFTLLGLYGGLLYPLSYDELVNSENMLNRRKDRIARRTVLTTRTVDVNPRTLAVKMKKIENNFEQMSEEILKLEAGFAPIASSERRQSLLLEISTLVRKSGMELLAIAGKAAPQNSKDIATVVDHYLKRPLLKLTARCDYWELLDFLDGLKNLSANVAVMQIELHVESMEMEDDKKKQDSPSDLLQVFMMLAI